MIVIGIVGSRTRNSEEDKKKLMLKIFDLCSGMLYTGSKLITGDCDRGGDKFAREIASNWKDIEVDIKRIRDPKTGEEMDFNNHRSFTYYEMVKIFYARNEEIAKEEMDYLVALVTSNRKGGTENTIKYFKKHHEDWEDKLILI